MSYDHGRAVVPAAKARLDDRHSCTLRDPENSTIAEVWQSVPGWMMGAAGVDTVGVVAWLDILLASAPALPGGSGPLLDMARRPHERAHGRCCYGQVDKQPGSRYVIGKPALAA